MSAPNSPDTTTRLLAPTRIVVSAPGGLSKQRARADPGRRFAEERLDDREVGDDDRDERLTTCPLASGYGALGSCLEKGVSSLRTPHNPGQET